MGEEDLSKSVWQRRAFLKGAAAGGVLTTTGLAGCTGESGGDTLTPTSQGTLTATETPKATDPPKEGGKLVYSSGDDTQNLHPHYMASKASSVFVNNIVEPLFLLNNNLKSEPHLVKDYTLENETDYTFELEQGVQFHPPVSREMVADDVVSSFQQIKNDKESYFYSDFQVIDRIESTGEYTVEMDLKEPFPLFIDTILTVDRASILPEEQLTDGQPLGTGPFKFDKRERGNFSRMSKFQNYWRDEYPYFDTVESRPKPEGSVRLQALTDGNSHVIAGVPSKDADKLKNSDDVQLEPLKGRAIEFISFNVEEEPFDDKRVRQAVRHVLDKPKLIQFALQGWGTPAVTTLPPDSPYVIDASPEEQNLEKAQSLLDDAGYGDGFTVTFKLPKAYPRSVEMATPLKQWLSQVGITAELQRVTWDTWISEVYGKVDYQMTTVPFFGLWDPVGALNRIFHSEGFHNYFNYSNSELDALLEQAKKTVDEEKRMERYKEAQQIIREDAPLLTPFYRTQLFGRRNSVEGELLWGTGTFRLWRNWFTDA